MIAQEPVSTDFFAFEGGMNLVAPALAIAQGALLDAQNYEPAITGGYTRTGGYERFSGKPAPSAGITSTVAATLTTTPAAGDTVVCGAVMSLFVKAITGGMVVANANGLFPASTAITVNAVQVGQTTPAPSGLVLSGAPQDDAQLSLDAGNVLRNLIAAVPGSGPVRGIWLFNNIVYVWRDNAGGTAGAVYASSATGWVQIGLFSELKFNAGLAGSNAITEGCTIKGTTSGATGIVMRVCRETGVFNTGNATGRYIVQPLAGVFAGSETVKCSVDGFSGVCATVTGPATQITIAPGGKYQFINYNFGGAAATQRFYGVSGVDRAFEFDGVVYVPLNSTATIDKPSYVTAVNNYLYLANMASLFNSSLANPYGYEVSTGAGQIAVGDTITGLQQMKGAALAIFTRNTTQQLVGASSASWAKSYVSVETGAVPYTTQTIGDTYSLDDRGVISIQATQAYGNFEFSTISRAIQPLIDSMRGKVVTSCVVRQKDQYRIFCSDGSVLVMYQDNNGQQPYKAFTKLQYPVTPACVTSQEDSSGVERLFMGDSNGFVYELNKGTSFDGQSIEAFARVWYVNNRSPRLRKRYRKAVLEMSALAYSTLACSAEFSYGDPGIGIVADGLAVSGGGGYWGSANWDQFYWDAQTINQPSVRIDGTGVNMSLMFYSNNALDAGHTLQGAIIHYSARRAER
ncbi:hypothetical protein [Undibacterium sp.]|uniref:hypothetical protein n=1 Tax=Undibacterium sp. TaxID=1914977 RepID=UPI00374D2A07